MKSIFALVLLSIFISCESNNRVAAVDIRDENPLEYVGIWRINGLETLNENRSLMESTFKRKYREKYNTEANDHVLNVLVSGYDIKEIENVIEYELFKNGQAIGREVSGSNINLGKWRVSNNILKIDFGNEEVIMEKGIFGLRHKVALDDDGISVLIFNKKIK